MDRTGLELDGIELGWTGIDWTGMSWTRLDGSAWTVLVWNLTGLKWAGGIDRTGMS
jgi:hypothetical protein